MEVNSSGSGSVSIRRYSLTLRQTISTGDVLFVLRKGMLPANVGLSLLANRVGGNIMLLFVGAIAPILVSPAMLAAVIVMSLSIPAMPALLCMWVPQVG